MRNLKKILALVLALMMVLSVMVTASASFKDDADIAHTEAVEVMAAAGILNGDENGNFRPTDALERSSSAKLIAYLMLGEDIALVDQTNTEFADVALTHWASGYIAYAYELGIVVGDGTGNYNPNEAVNGYSFAKMVLLALCNMNLEKVEELDPTAVVAPTTGNWGQWKVAPFTGNYALKVRLAIAELQDKGIDLLAGLEDISLNADLTREHAAQMVFNALNAYELLESTYGMTKVEDENEDGLNYYVWCDAKTDEELTDRVITDTYIESFAAGTTDAAIMKALGITAKSDTEGQSYKNTDKWGEKFLCNIYVNGKDTIDATHTLDVYMTAEGTLKFMYTDEELAVAYVAKAAETKGENKGLYAWTFGDAEPIYAAKDAYTAGASYLVAVNAAGELVTEPVLAATVEGKVMSQGADYVRIDGTKYTFENEIEENLLGLTRVLYLATDGTVLACAEPGKAPVAETPETLVYVIGFYSVYVPTVPGTPAVYNEYGEEVTPAVAPVLEHYDRYAQTVNMDGEIVNYLYRTGDAADLKWYADAGLKAVTVDEKTGVATFATPAKSDVTPITITEKGIKYTDDTNQYYYNTAEYVEIVGTLSKATVGEGAQKAASAVTNAWAVYSGTGTNKTVSKVIYWTAPATGDATPVNPDLSYDMFAIYNVSSDAELITVVENNKEIEKTVWLHTAIINGEKVTIKTYSDTQAVTGPACYAVDEYGIYTDIAAIEAQASGEVTNLYGTLATIGDGSDFEDYDIAEVAVIDVSAKDGNGSVELGETITVLYNEKNGVKTITLIYITASVKPAE